LSLTFRPSDAKKAFKQWIRIIKKLSSDKESEYKLAVIEADNLLEGSLEKNGYKGELMEDRLDKIDAIILSNKEQVLEAHKIRNNIVHNPDFTLSVDQAKKAIDIYEEAFRNLEVF